MSRFSGKCDLYDWMMIGYDDELKAFEDLKKKTGGVLYQMHNIKEVDETNQDFIAEHCEAFKAIKREWQDPDKRYKAGYKDLTTYTYEYYGKEYTAKELKKKGGVYIRMPIRFDDILELMKYYPYVISMASTDKERSTIVISTRPYPEIQSESMIKCGYEGHSVNHYNKELAEHYREIVRLLDKDLPYRERIVPIEGLTLLDEDHYALAVRDPIDPNHPIEFHWGTWSAKPYWTGPMRASENAIAVHKRDVDGFLKEEIEKGQVKIKYVSAVGNDY